MGSDQGSENDESSTKIIRTSAFSSRSQTPVTRPTECRVTQSAFKSPTVVLQLFCLALGDILDKKLILKTTS